MTSSLVFVLSTELHWLGAVQWEQGGACCCVSLPSCCFGQELFAVVNAQHFCETL